MHTERRYETTGTVARILEISPVHVRRLVERGKLSAVPVGNILAIPLDEVYALKAKREANPPKKRLSRTIDSQADGRVESIRGGKDVRSLLKRKECEAIPGDPGKMQPR